MQEVLMPKLSVVVTAYNVEAYIAQCVESVLRQDYKDMEIILVNASSTDNSGMICKAYADKYPNVTYTECENTGPGGTRNAGIRMAKGRYLGFVDGDDVIEPDRFSTVMRHTENGEFDAVYCSCYRFFNDDLSTKSRRIIDDMECNGKEEIWQKMILAIMSNTESAKEVSGTMCFGVFKKEIIENNGLYVRSMEEVFSEDNFFNIEYLRYANRIKTINAPLYGYRMRTNSISNVEKPYAIPALFNMFRMFKELGTDDGINRAELDKRCRARFLFYFSPTLKKKVDSCSLKETKAYILKTLDESGFDFNFDLGELKNVMLQVRLFRFLLKYKLYTPLYLLVKVYSRFVKR